MKNYIMVSGDNRKHLSKVCSIDGVVMLNLEDGVAKKNKKSALANIKNFLEVNNPKQEIVVRVNSLEEGGLEEIKELNSFNISFRIPKVKHLGELKDVFKITQKDIYLSIETKDAFFNLKDFNHNQIKGFYLGILDLFDDLKLNHNLIKFGNKLIDKILIDFSMNCRYLEKRAVGFVYQQYKDLEGFRRWCEIQKDYGIEGVGTITPTQLQIANDVFRVENLDYAKMIVERFENEGVFTIDGLYVDEPIYKNYKLIYENSL
jgi:citrate lyase subunit beta/citryl-CoA lyase